MNDELIQKLKEAKFSGRYLVTVSFLDPKLKGQPNELKMYYHRINFPSDDVIRALDKTKEDFVNKEMKGLEKAFK
jgi:hypothetical protein